MAHMTVVSAADGNAVRGLLRATIDILGPVYIRIGRGVENTVYDRYYDRNLREGST
jgi:transketolase